tara:strand:+ start:384 stop:560 length:177 start_codon:yes stop_codon:yes gene_type:complete
MKNTIYVLSLVLLLTSTFLLIEYPDSGRLGLIAGFLFFLAIVCNIYGFALPKANKNLS